MSVTFTIADNERYCRENFPERIVSVAYECLCCDSSMDIAPTPGCPHCRGSGICGVETFPYELNVANGNFRTLMAALGMEAESGFGDCQPRELLQAVTATSAGWIVREERVESLPEQAQAIYCGIDQEQAERYLEALAEIAREAERREQPVIWY